jgi:DNA-binding IclR family transcriptional regulator
MYSRIFHEPDSPMAFDNVAGNFAIRPAAHLSMNYFLDTTDRVSRWLGRDVMDSMVFLAMIAENYRDHDFTDKDEFGTETEPFTPVSVTALARTLDMPYETVRRHALALRAAGFCRKQKGGYVVPTHVANRLDLDDLLSEITVGTQRLVEDLAQVGAPLATTTSQALNEMSRQSARMAIRFYVDGLGDLCRSLQMDVLRATILMNIVRRNHSAFEAGLGQDVDAISLTQWFTDPMRRAVSTYCVAKTLRLPYETVRRHCRALQDQGAVETDDKGGLVVTGRLLETQIGRDVAKSTWVATRSFMNSLAQLGRDMAKPAYA